MRYLFGFLCVCALGMAPLVGCSDAQPECERAADCDDGDDCSVDVCDPANGACSNTPADDGTKCDFDGLPGLCKAGVCEDAMLCEGVECNDDNECTEDLCTPADGTCDNLLVADDRECDFDGFPGLCKAGVCEDAMLCEGIECDDDNECTEDVCVPADGTCDNSPVPDGTPCRDGASTCQSGSCGACGNEKDTLVYGCLEFTDGKGEHHTGTDASSAIGSECVRGPTSSDPPIEGCGGETLDVVACFPQCPAETIQALADCVRDCTQDTTAELCPPGLSGDCVECTGASVACGAAFCTHRCVADPTAAVCINCLCDNGCIPHFATCSGIPSDECGAGGTGGTGGSGGSGGSGGRGCSVDNDCIDFGQDPCITSMCIEMVCSYDSLPDGQVCPSDTGLSACLGGVCQLIWPSCAEPEAQDGDFCEPTESIPRLGRCESGTCVVAPCEIAFDCWDGNVCTVGICDELNGTCSQGNAPNGTPCLPLVGGQCIDGVCSE